MEAGREGNWRLQVEDDMVRRVEGNCGINRFNTAQLVGVFFSICRLAGYVVNLHLDSHASVFFGNNVWNRLYK